jgi:hypothetical protein
MILVEEATNASCPPCAAQNPAFEEYLKSHLSEVVPMTYHASWPGATDPMYLYDTQMSETRIVTYYGINGVPTAVANGTDQSSPSAIETGVAKYRGKTSPITITIDENNTGSSLSFTVTVQSTVAVSGQKLRVAAVEFHHHYDNAGTNGETDFYFITRRMFPTPAGTTLNIPAGGNYVYTNSYSIPADFNASDMYVVAFVQDDGSKEVLQAASTLKTLSVTPSVDNPYLKVDSHSSITKDITITNTSNEDLNVNFTSALVTGYNPSGWSTEITPAARMISANQSTTVTLKINSGSAAGFAAATVTATPVSPTGIVVPKTLNVFALSNNTKYIVFDGTDPLGTPTYNALQLNSLLRDNFARVPLMEGIFDNYTMTDYDGAVFLFNYDGRGIFGGDTVFGQLPVKMHHAISNMVQAGKGLFISSELDLYYASGPNGSPDARNFYANILGVQSSQVVTRFQQDQQGNTTIISFTATGVAGDTITDGLTFTLNNINASYQYYDFYTDEMILSPITYSTPIIKYDDGQIGGVRAITNGGGKVVYLGFTPEIIRDNNSRNGLIDKICNWLFKNGTTTPTGEISLNVSKLDFGSSKIGVKKDTVLTITNIGTADLTITNIYDFFDFDTTGVFTVETLSYPLSIAAGSSLDVKISFTPKAQDNYDGLLYINSNDAKSPEISIDLIGKGELGGGAQIKTTDTTNILDYGSVLVGKNKPLALVLFNTGNVTLNISKITKTDVDNVFSWNVPGNLYPDSIAVGGNLQLELRFAPLTAKAYSATITIESDAINYPEFNVTLTGVGNSTGVNDPTISSSFMMAVVPNPATDHAVLQYTLNGTQQKSLEINIVDVTGKTVANITNIEAQPGSNSYELNLQGYSTGTYYIIANIGTSSCQIPLIIAR